MTAVIGNPKLPISGGLRALGLAGPSDNFTHSLGGERRRAQGFSIASETTSGHNLAHAASQVSRTFDAGPILPVVSRSDTPTTAVCCGSDVAAFKFVDMVRARRGRDPEYTVLAAVVPDLLYTSAVQQDETARLLGQWAKDGEADSVLVDRLMKSVNITTKELEDGLVSKIAQAGKDFPGDPDAFARKVLDTLDRRRFSRVDAAIQEVMAVFGNDLEAVIRTGSSGARHLQLKGVQEGACGIGTIQKPTHLTTLRATQS